jgi:hypothetical protein
VSVARGRRRRLPTEEETQLQLGLSWLLQLRWGAVVGQLAALALARGVLSFTAVTNAALTFMGTVERLRVHYGDDASRTASVVVPSKTLAQMLHNLGADFPVDWVELEASTRGSLPEGLLARRGQPQPQPPAFAAPPPLLPSRYACACSGP